MVIYINFISGMAEKLLKMLSGMNERYEIKLMVMNLISRLVGIHQVSQPLAEITFYCRSNSWNIKKKMYISVKYIKICVSNKIYITCIYKQYNFVSFLSFQLILLNYYTFLIRYLQPHQRGKLCFTYLLFFTLNSLLCIKVYIWIVNLFYTRCQHRPMISQTFEFYVMHIIYAIY